MSRGLKISVVTPSFNQGHYIEETIRSVLDQDYDNVEYIVMDGGSSDQTVSILEKYADRIAYWVSEKDAGQSDALRRGFARATGDILGWINSDDVLAPGALRAIAAAFEDGRADIVAGVVDIVSNGELVYHHRTGLSEGPLELGKLLDLDREWLTGRFFYQPEVYFSRAIYEAAGNTINVSLHYSMDYDLWVRLARSGARIRPIDFSIARFRMHPDQKTSETAAYLPELTAHANAFRRRLGMPDVAPDAASLGEGQRPLRVALLNDHGFNYGAGRAHRRIAECLAAAHMEVLVYAFRNGVDDTTPVSFAAALDVLRAEEVDVIVVGNLHGAFPEGINLADLAAIAPVLLVTHDFFWFTGRCPYPMSCDAFLFTCPPTCPTRTSYPVIPFDVIPDAHRAKLGGLALGNITVAANSAYVETVAKRFFAAKMPDVDPDAKVRRFHLVVPEPDYRPGDGHEARDALSIPRDRFVVLTASSSVIDTRKGFRHVLEACRLADDGHLYIVAMGQVSEADQVAGVHYLGHLDTDENIARCFRAADLYVSGSANETFGQTFVEAAMCGCASLGYAVGGIPEVIVPDETGWLVELNDIAGLAKRLRGLMRQDAKTREAQRRRTWIYARSQFGAPHLIASMTEIFRDVVNNEAVLIRTGVQFGGGRTLPIRRLAAAPICRVILDEGFSPIEGPFAEQGVFEAVQWQTLPRGSVNLLPVAPGRHIVTLAFANLAEEQAVTVRSGPAILAQLKTRDVMWSVRHEIELALELDAGVTVLTVEAEKALPMDERDLHLAFYPPKLRPAEADEEPGGVRRLVASSGAERVFTPEKEASRPGQALLPDVLLHDGYARAEGPYPQLGVTMRLAWQIAADAEMTFLGRLEAGVLAIDLVVPCEQTFEVSVGSIHRRFVNVPVSSWDRPTRLLLQVEETEDTVQTIIISGDRHIVDDANRTLYTALIGLSLLPDPTSSSEVTDRYGTPDMPVRTVQAAPP